MAAPHMAGVVALMKAIYPALTPEDALQQGILLSLVNDPAPSGFRSNVGFVNPTTGTVTVQYTVFDAGAASVVGTGELSLPPLAFFQINNVFNAVGEFGQVVTNVRFNFIHAPLSDLFVVLTERRDV